MCQWAQESQWNNLGALGLAGCGVGLRSVEVQWSGVHSCSIFWAWPGGEWGRARGSQKVCVTTGLGLVGIPSSGNINSVVRYQPSTFLNCYFLKAFVSSHWALLSVCVCVYFFLTYFLLWVVQKRVRETQYDQNPAGKCPHCPGLFLLSVLRSL